MKLQLEYAICRCVHLDLIPVFIRRVARINLTDSGAVGGSSYTPALGYIPGETIRLSVDGKPGVAGFDRRRRCRSAPRHDESIRLLQLSKL